MSPDYAILDQHLRFTRPWRDFCATFARLLRDFCATFARLLRDVRIVGDFVTRTSATYGHILDVRCDIRRVDSACYCFFFATDITLEAISFHLICVMFSALN